MRSDELCSVCSSKTAWRQARSRAASRLRVYAGYAGWGPGQLAREIRVGAWIVARADARSIFSLEPSELWPRVHELMGRIEARAICAPSGPG